MPKSVKRTMPSRRTAILSALLVVIIIVVAFVLAHHKTTTVIPSTNPVNNTPARGTSTPSNSSSEPNSSNSNSATNSQSTGGPPPITPFGNFVSNHHPGGGNPTSEASVCNTTDGATCYIEFTKDNVVKKLDARVAAPNGAAYWYWDVSSAGLDAGSWKITAVATLNGQTKTADDIMPLVVQ